MRELCIDTETFSTVNLKTEGLYKYFADPSFEMLLFQYSLDGAPVEVVDILNGEKVPQEILDALTDPTILKTSYNWTFERGAIRKCFGITVPLNQAECTLVKAGMLGLPMSLDGVGIALKTDTQKATIGKKLIRIFCIPCKPVKSNGFRTRNLPEHFPEEWAQFKDYGVVDVYTEMAIREKIKFFDIPAQEKRLYILDQKINDLGILGDAVLIGQAIEQSLTFTSRLLEEAKELTGLANPKSVQQLLAWLQLEIDEEVTTLRAKAVHKLLQGKPSPIVRRVLEIRQQISKTSIRKYDSIRKFMGVDGRVRGTLQFIGANRTWRWAGRGPQFHNLVKNEIEDINLARDVCRNQGLEELEFLFGDVPKILSQLIRTALVAAPGKILVMSDFSAIEARVIAWYAKEEWRLEVFRTHGKIYEASGAAMFRVPIEQVTKGSKLRQKAKISELALGYQGSVGALRTMGAEEMGLTEEELPELVGRWRDANPKIVKFWYAVQDAAITCVQTREPQRLGKLLFYMDRGLLFIKLPSGRSLAYLKPVLKPNKNGYLSLSYFGVNQKTRQWQEIPTYGGKLVENIVQATARDLLAEKMLAVDAEGYSIVLHVHDEIVVEVDEMFAKGTVDDLNRIMSAALSWTDGLPLGADTYFSPFYKKD